MRSEAVNDRSGIGRGDYPVVALAALLAALCLCARPLAAATITVNRYDSHWGGEDGQCSLREAIAAANLDDEFPFTGSGECTPGSGADTIVLTDHVILTLVDHDLWGNNGLPVVTSEILIEGNNKGILRQSGAGVPPFRFFRVTNPNGNLTLKNVNLANGLSGFSGGAIRNVGRLTLIDSRLSENRAELGGGAIDNQYKLTVRGSVLDDNSTNLYSGGAIASLGWVELFDSLLIGNDAGEHGGGIYSWGVTLSLIRCRLEDNTAAGDGGGVLLRWGSGKIVESVLEDNSATRGGGIGSECSTLRLVDSALSRNIAIGDGGGVFTSCPSETPSDVGVIRSTVSDNQAYYGGGGLQIDFGLASLTDSTVSGNRVEFGPGGGLVNKEGTVTLTHSTVMNNSSSWGGAGIHNDSGTVSVASSILADSAGGANCSGEIDDLFNNFDDDDSCPWPGVISLIDPNLADNGGPTMTHALFEGSAAIDKTFLCYQYTGEFVDQRGGFRDLACDSGAFEFGTDDRYELSGEDGNDTFCHGHRIALGQVEHHLLLNEDWVRFDVQVGATYEIETGNLHGSPPADTWLDLRRDCTTHLDSDDDGGVGVASKITYTATAEDAEAGGLDVRVREKVAYDSEIGYDLSVTCVANCPACAAPGGSSLDLTDETVPSFRLIEACQEIKVKRTVVALGGVLILRAGEGVSLFDGVEVLAEESSSWGTIRRCACLENASRVASQRIGHPAPGWARPASRRRSPAPSRRPRGRPACARARCLRGPVRRGSRRGRDIEA